MGYAGKRGRTGNDPEDGIVREGDRTHIRAKRPDGTTAMAVGASVPVGISAEAKNLRGSLSCLLDGAGLRRADPVARPSLVRNATRGTGGGTDGPKQPG